MNFFRLLTKSFFVSFNLIVVVLFLLACLVPYVSPAYFWPVSILGLAFPFLLVVMLLFVVFWLIFDIKYCLLPVCALLIGWRSIAVLVAFHRPASSPAKPAGSMTVMSYNVRYFKNFTYSAQQNKSLRQEILSLIAEQKPDILCLQEFYTSENPHDFNNREDISNEMGLPYRYFSSDHNYLNNHSGSIIFSRYPILRAQKVKLMESSASENVVYADVLKGKDTLRIFTMHLQSIYLSNKDLAGLEKVKKQQDTGLVVSRTILTKIRRAFIKRQQQAETVAREISASPYPVIICGDFNDTPNSYAYFTIRGKLRDAFLEKGRGIGRTYASISPTLRIDYIFTDPSFRVSRFQVIHRELSDHYPIVSDLVLQRKDSVPGVK